MELHICVANFIQRIHGTRRTQEVQRTLFSRRNVMVLKMYCYCNLADFRVSFNVDDKTSELPILDIVTYFPVNTSNNLRILDFMLDLLVMRQAELQSIITIAVPL
jgi:hypothetical protein